MKDERELILIPKIEDYVKYVLNIIIKLPRTEKFSIGTEYKNRNIITYDSNGDAFTKIDFLYDKKKKELYVDEINSIPSCFSHHLWEDANISYKELFNIMISDTIKNINKDSEMITTMDMDVLKDLKNSDIKEFK